MSMFVYKGRGGSKSPDFCLRGLYTVPLLFNVVYGWPPTSTCETTCTHIHVRSTNWTNRASHMLQWILQRLSLKRHQKRAPYHTCFFSKEEPSISRSLFAWIHNTHFECRFPIFHGFWKMASKKIQEEKISTVCPDLDEKTAMSGWKKYTGKIMGCSISKAFLCYKLYC